MDDRAWNTLSTSHRIAALDIEPATAELEAIKRTFGPGVSHVLANDLHKSDALKYRQWKESRSQPECTEPDVRRAKALRIPRSRPEACKACEAGGGKPALSALHSDKLTTPRR
jgi:hypothetical protein